MTKTLLHDSFSFLPGNYLYPRRSPSDSVSPSRLHDSFSFLPGNYLYPRRLASVSVSPSRTVRWVSSETTFTPLFVSVTNNKRRTQVCNVKKIEPEGESLEPEGESLEVLEMKLKVAWDLLKQARDYLGKTKLPPANRTKEYYRDYDSVLEMEINSMELIVQGFAALREYHKKRTGKEDDLKTVWKRVQLYRSMVMKAQLVKALAELRADLDLSKLEAAVDWETEVTAKLTEAKKQLSRRGIPIDLEKVHKRILMLTTWLEHATKECALLESQKNPDSIDIQVAREWEVEVMAELYKSRRQLRNIEDYMSTSFASEKPPEDSN